MRYSLVQGDRIFHSDTRSGISPDSSLLQDVARVSIEQCQIGRYSSRHIGCGSILVYGWCIFGVFVYNRQKFDTQSGERDWTINRPFLLQIVLIQLVRIYPAFVYGVLNRQNIGVDYFLIAT